MAGVGQANSRAVSTTSMDAVNGGAPATNEQDGNKSSFSKLLAGVKKSFFSAVNRFREKYGFHSRRTCNLPKQSYVQEFRGSEYLVKDSERDNRGAGRIPLVAAVRRFDKCDDYELRKSDGSSNCELPIT
ncbi:hypothetical protein [Microbulbifer sp. JMSA003]|uniref:hypothetical protein n=1 Tax=Microbulbifer sp. JMSA003 TaxID=3243369 RepID=UPI004039508C